MVVQRRYRRKKRVDKFMDTSNYAIQVDRVKKEVARRKAEIAAKKTKPIKCRESKMCMLTKGKHKRCVIPKNIVQRICVYTNK